MSEVGAAAGSKKTPEKDAILPQKDLTHLFKAKSVAIVGASANPDKIGHQILRNLIEGGFEGDIYPINPKEKTILEKDAYPSVTDVPNFIDLVVISVNANFVMPVLKECVEKGVKHVIVITSGFSEVGNAREEQEIKDIADQFNISLVGPNTLGVVYPPNKMNTSFGPRDVILGKIAFISQSGALAIALMGWTKMEKIGLAALVSVGNKCDIGEEELISYFNEDKNVDVIAIYMEGFKDGRKFMQTAIKKPVVVLKVGRSQRGARAAASHTGSLAGSDQIYNAAFKQLGVLRAQSFTEAFGWARCLSLPAPDGNDAIIITNGGGIGVRTTDECVEAGIKLFDDPDWLEEKFRETMPSFGCTKNPVDITGQAPADAYQKATRIALEEDRIKAVLVLYCETVITNPLKIARSIAGEYKKSGSKKPLLVAMVGGERTREALHYLNHENIPAFDSISEVVDGLKVLYKWQEYKERKLDKPDIKPPPQEVLDIINNAKKEGKKILLEHEARKILELCGVTTPKWGYARNLEEALEMAKGMYPFAMKIVSPEIVHKTDVGGVVLNVRNEEGLKLRYNTMINHIKEVMPAAKIEGVNLIQMVKGIECIVGLSRDPQFGPAVMFGLGGVFVEVMKDVAFRIVPFGKVEATRLIHDVKGNKILDGFRGIVANKPSIIQSLLAIQRLAPYVQECDINPLISNEFGSFAVDARIILE